MKTRIILAGLLACFASPLFAQGGLPKMSLADALEIARDRNPEYRRAIVDRNARSSSLRRGYGTFLPSITASMNWNGNRQTTVTGNDDFGRPVNLPEPVTFLSSSASQNIQASVTLFDGLRNVKQLRAARYDLDAADEGVRGVGIQVDAEVKTRFYQAIRRQRLIAVEQDLLASAQDRLSANERLFRVGSTDQVDVLGAQVDVARQEQALEQARGEAGIARLAVLQQLGILDESLDFESVGSLAEPFDPSVLDAELLVRRSLEISPTVTQADAQAAAASQRAGAQRGQWLPTVSLQAGYSRSLQERDYSAFGQLNPRDYGFGFGVNFSFPIFSGFQRSDDIVQADATAHRAEETYRERTLQVEQEVRAAFIRLRSAYDGLLIQRRATDLSRRQVELAREQFRIGSASMPFISLQQINASAALDERALVDAEYNFAIALVNLEARVGEPIVVPQ